MRHKLYALISMLVLTASSLNAATLFLKDGSTVKGTIVGATARDVQVHTPDGIRKIESNRISRIDYSDGEERPATPPPSAPPSSVRYDAPGNEQQEFSINLGLASPVSEVDLSGAGGTSGDNGEAGFLIGAQYIYSLNPRWGAGFDLGFFNRSDETSSGLLPFADTAVGGNSLLLMGIAKYSLIPRGRVRPYLALGLGTNRTTTEIDARPAFGFAWSDTNTDETRRLVGDSKWGLASALRLGIDFQTSDPSFFSFEMGWTEISNSRYSATAAGRDLGLGSVTGGLSAFTVSGRWGWRY